METARLKLQGIYSLLAGLSLLIGVPLYQSVVLGPAGYRVPADAAFSHGTYGPLLLWMSDHGSAFIIFRMLELVTFLLAIRLPLALHRALHSHGRTLSRWMLAGGLGGLSLFAAMIALSTVTFFNAAADYRHASTSSATGQAILNSLSSFYGIEALAQNTLGGILLAIFLLCASLLIARSGKLSALLVYFGLLVAALMAALAVLFAVSPPEAQTQLNTPALASFAVWLIWLGILLTQHAGRLVAPASATAGQGEQPATAMQPDAGADEQQDHQAEQMPASQPASSPSSATELPGTPAEPPS